MKVIKRNNGSDIKIYAKTLEDSALEQIKVLGEFEPYKNSKIRIMPDCHAGAGCTIGTTMEIKDKITPNLVGVDIGCGMLTIKLKETDIDLQKLDFIINEFIPSGFNVHQIRQKDFDFSKLKRKYEIDLERPLRAIGSLGGGNHFIEIDKDSKGALYLVIHSGSRGIGNQIAKLYQDTALKHIKKDVDIPRLIAKLKFENRHKEISEAIKKAKSKPITKIKKDLAYLENEFFSDYMNDMSIMQEYASLNRRTIANIILEKSGLTEYDYFETIHNYIDFDRMILRKGAVSAEYGEKLLIPINMRDGSILATGKGNSDWNYSAPHGAGRLMSRKEAHRKLDFEEFKEQMKDVYSTSVLKETLDEAPNAYKSMNEIVEAILPTADILEIIKPIYNFKAY